MVVQDCLPKTMPGLFFIVVMVPYLTFLSDKKGEKSHLAQTDEYGGLITIVTFSLARYEATKMALLEEVFVHCHQADADFCCDTTHLFEMQAHS